MVKEKILVYAVAGVIFLVGFLLMLFALYLSAGGLFRFETYLISLIYAAFWSLVFATLLKRKPTKFTAWLENKSVRKIFQELKTAVPWALLLSSILIHSSLNDSAFGILDLIFLALVSFWAGVIFVDLESIITGCLMAFGLCVLFVFLALSLPAFLGVLSSLGLNEIVYSQAVRMTFLSVFPVPIILGFASAILGGYFGEKIFANV